MMGRFLSIGFAALIGLVSMLAFGRETFAIAPLSIVAAVGEGGLNVSVNQLSILSSPQSRVSDPQLQMVSVERWSNRQAKLRMRCTHPQQCLPFYVIASWTRSEDARQAVELWKSPPGEPSRSLTNPILVRAGTRATLMFEGQRIRVVLPVICLENGFLGKRIRVTSTDRKQIYKAEVLSSHSLRVRL